MIYPLTHLCCNFSGYRNDYGGRGGGGRGRGGRGYDDRNDSYRGGRGGAEDVPSQCPSGDPRYLTGLSFLDYPLLVPYPFTTITKNVNSMVPRRLKSKEIAESKSSEDNTKQETDTA